ncbi:hypothetical protein [Solidesulfovibrio sp.]
MNKKLLAAGIVALVLAGTYFGLGLYASKAARAQVEIAVARMGPAANVAYKDVSYNILTGHTVIDDVSILPPGGLTPARIDRIVVRSLDQTSPNPAYMAVDVHGLQLDPAALGRADAARFAALGYSGPLPCDLSVDYNYARDKRELTVNAVSLSVKDVGAIRLSLTLGNLDFDPDQAANLLFSYPRILLGRAELVYTDASLVERVIKQEAAKQGVDVATLKKTMAADADATLETAKSPLMASVVTALKQFIENPRQLSMSVSPATPLPLGEIGRAGSPEAVAKLLNLQVKS